MEFSRLCKAALGVDDVVKIRVGNFRNVFLQNNENSGSRRDSKTGCATERQNRSGGFRQKGARHSGRPGRRRLVDFCENLKYSRKNDICFQHIL